MSEAERLMQIALRLAELGRGQTSPNPMVGAVIVQHGEIVGQGAHLKAGGPHAEVHALRMAGDRAKGATVYVTLEPCAHVGRTPPCADALIEAGVAEVVVACTDPNPEVSGAGIRRLQQAGIRVTVGVLEKQAQALNEAYFHWRATGRPFVVWKCAATLDGYIATHQGDSRYVTSPEARQSVHQLRQEHPAIAVGVGTLLADNPQLTIRLQGRPLNAWQPLRVVFDSNLRSRPDAEVFQGPGKTLIYTSVSDVKGGRAAQLQARGAEIQVVEADLHGRVLLPAALNDLGQRGLTSVLVEAGPTVAGALLRDRLVDKVVYYIAPKLLGGGMTAVQGRDPERMSEALRLTRVSVSQIGPDLRVEGYVSKLDTQH
ncbi:bifunctional diaminohydroxyphosphoribosylaminopyrimidine deaminase/5-amino-6-(5-phosphoribosylamino)uracil reductase RibD [Alicyclobacillus cycloheptanicus]|uniref:Riboflavin biosynthesis protein RibD n=1 Tax=Alicyclobacillus cycloheptanicus TaxID=1457 RepID=A0ABT9XHB4_9BACL|nr:bifunctional diaminohydroxyphosphoribosylaminopyrimidine deaminase/5-amino-6-(5-phosphoribosylamino)uracil reductase RibD [Alicyclobacillus cycloheptanicus]MDQ0189701.1 diaminohydroxyphosphoribosylaminopyrimidine deaminase/5-amino-6-(5-phosphoribosylamino)uracil reductase [Alicyclobacillus cycloheptanicus]WDM01913.1 bifunctional diaminohydroxyphosphoribosylaminopyrimidine deaminase/5-amino-6-(5-phosphoribosylamino)uracil reductase RibD [Alicyclobacillus cycloheptanicus]